MVSRRVREQRALWDRAGGRPMKVNDPMGFLVSTPTVPQPQGPWSWDGPMFWDGPGGWPISNESIRDYPCGSCGTTGGGCGCTGNPGFHWVGSDRPWDLLGGGAGERLAAVHRATQLVAGPLFAVPWHVFRGRERLETPTWISDPQNAEGDGRPGSKTSNPWSNSHTFFRGKPGPAFWGELVVSLIWHGEAFVFYENRGAHGKPERPLHLLNPGMVDVRGDWGIPEYWIDDVRLGYDHRAGGAGHVLHVRGLPPYRGHRGIGVLERHAHSLGLAAKIENYASRVFTNGVPSGYLSVSSPGLTQEDADRLRSAWMRAHGSSNESVAVLNATTEYTPLQMSPVDAALVQMQDFTLRQIAHAFHLPASMLDVPGPSNTYSNVEMQQLQFKQQTLLPWARLIESALETLLPVGQSLKLRLDGLERGTTASRYANYQMGLAGGWLTKDEIRDLEDLPPLPQDTTPQTPDTLPDMTQPADTTEGSEIIDDEA